MTERAMEITRRLVTAHPKGPLFRNKNGKGWTTEAVNCAFSYIQVRMGKEEMASGGLKISPEEIQALIPQLRQTRLSEGVEIPKTAAELRCEAKRKLTQRQAVNPPRKSNRRPTWVEKLLMGFPVNRP